MGVGLAAVYLLFAFANKQIAYVRVLSEVHGSIPDAVEVMLLPQPPNAFHWMAMVETPEACWQTFLINGRQDQLEWAMFGYEKENSFIHKAEQTEVAQFYRWFSRFPVASYHHADSMHVVEYRDLQFSLHPTMVALLGLQRSPPFVLRIEMDDEGNVLSSQIQ